MNGRVDQQDLRDLAAGDVREVTSQLREARIAAGLGIRETARAAALSPGTIRNIDAGVRSPTLKAAGRYAHAVDQRFEVFPAVGPVFFSTEVWRRYVLPDLYFRSYRVPPSKIGQPGVIADQTTHRWLEVAASHIQWERRELGVRIAPAAREWQVSPKTLGRVELFFYGWPSLGAVALVLRHVGFRVVAVPRSSPTPWPPWVPKPTTAKEWAKFRREKAAADALSRRNRALYGERDKGEP